MQPVSQPDLVKQRNELPLGYLKKNTTQTMQVQASLWPLDTPELLQSCLLECSGQGDTRVIRVTQGVNARVRIR